MRLFRPTGGRALHRVAQSGWRRWPPQFPDQPGFNPVLTFDDAGKITGDRNPTGNSAGKPPDNVGLVTCLEMVPEFAERYPVQRVGGKAHCELWVPAEEREAFNDAIGGQIELVTASLDDRPVGIAPELAGQG